MNPRDRKKKILDALDIEDKDHLAYIGLLAGGLAHSIKTPLQSLRLNLELLREDIDAGKKKKQLYVLMDRMQRETGHLREILDEFLSFARPPKMELLPTDINKFLKDIIDFVELECRRANIEIICDFAKNIYPVPIDRQQFGQLILNLLMNAKEAISARRKGKGKDGHIVVSTREGLDEVIIDVEDDGGGVPVGLEEDIFRAFISNKPGGTGLGLNIARRLAFEHGGRLTLENHPGEGAKFSVIIPRGKFLEHTEIKRLAAKSQTMENE